MTPLRDIRSYFAGRRNLRAHAWQSLANYFQQGFGLVFGVILARILSPGDFGAYAFAATSVFLALLPATWSLAPSLVADAGRTPALHTTAASFGWCIAGARLAIVTALVVYFYFQGLHQTAVLCLLCGVAESCRELNNVQRAYLEGQGTFKPNLISAILGVMFCLGVIVPLAHLRFGPITLALPALGTLMIDSLVYRYYSGRSIFVRPAWTYPYNTIKESFWLWLNTVAEVVLMRLDSWYIGKFQGDMTLGLYNRAFGYSQISHMLLGSFASNPTIVGFARCETGAARRRLLLRTAAILLAGGLLNWTMLFFFARPVVLFVFGPQWEGSVPIFEAFAGLSLAYAIGFLPTTLMLSARRYREIGLIRIAFVAGFAMTLFLVPGLRSPIAVAWLVQATWLFQGIFLLIRCRKLLADGQNS